MLQTSLNEKFDFFNSVLFRRSLKKEQEQFQTDFITAAISGQTGDKYKGRSVKRRRFSNLFELGRKPLSPCPTKQQLTTDTLTILGLFQRLTCMLLNSLLLAIFPLSSGGKVDENFCFKFFELFGHCFVNIAALTLQYGAE